MAKYKNEQGDVWDSETGEITKAQGFDWNGLRETMLQGATLGFGDELVGAMSHITGGDYTSARDAARDRYAGFQEQHPVGAVAAEVGGALPTAIGSGGLALGRQAIQHLPKWLTLALAGGTAGGIEGAGKAETMEQVPVAAGIGGGLGAVGGVVVPKAVGIGGDLLGAAWDPIKDRLFTSAGRRAQNAVRENLARDAILPGQLSANLQTMGPEATVADAAGRNIQQLGKTMMDQPGATEETMQRLINRQKQQQPRLTEALERTSGTDKEFNAGMREITATRKAQAQANYPDAYAGNIELTEELDELLTRPSARKAWTDARRMAADDGIELPDLYMRNDDGDIIGVDNLPSMEVLDWMKQGLDSVIDAQTDITGKLSRKGTKVLGIKQKLLEQLDDQNPSYKLARREFSDQSSMLAAARQGRKILKDDFEISEELLEDMTAADKEAYIVGATRAIKDRIASGGDTHDVTNKILGNNNVKRKLRNAFPDDKTYENFINVLETEQRMASTFNKIRGGSPTSANTAWREQVGPSFAQDLNAGKGIWGSGLLALGRYLNKDSIPEQMRNEVVEMLYNPARKDDVIAMLRKRGVPKKVVQEVREFYKTSAAGAATTGAAAGAGAAALTEE